MKRHADSSTHATFRFSEAPLPTKPMFSNGFHEPQDALAGRRARPDARPTAWNEFRILELWKWCGALAVVVILGLEPHGARAQTDCRPVLSREGRAGSARLSSDAVVARSVRPDEFVVASDRALWAVDAAGGERRLARLPAPARSVDVARATGLVAVVAPHARRAVVVFGPSRGGLRLLGGGVEPWRNPSRVSLGDVDGDGRIEALVLVTGYARFDPQPALRPFVYGWDGARLYPKWLGSRLSRPFDDATLGDLDGDGRDELVAVERTRDGRRELAAYRWRGFGFERLATSDPVDDVCGPAVDPTGRVLARTGASVVAFTLVDDRLVADR